MYRLDDQYLRPKKAAHLRRWHEDPLEVRENLKVWQGCNATILPLRKDSRVQFGLVALWMPKAIMWSFPLSLTVSSSPTTSRIPNTGMKRWFTAAI